MFDIGDAGPCNHRMDGDNAGPPGISVRFPVSQEITAPVPGLFLNLSALVSADEELVGFRTARGT